MNINQTRRITTAALASAIAVLVTMVASPATAQPPRTDRGASGIYESATLAVGSPLAALGGRTLAQYVQAHQQQDRRTYTVV